MRLRIRYRVDGLLRDVMTAPRRLGPAIVSRVKIMSGLDIAVLALPDVGIPHLAIDTAAQPGDSIAVLGYPEDGPYDVESGRIRSQQRLRSPDIYGNGTVTRAPTHSASSNVRARRRERLEAAVVAEARRPLLLQRQHQRSLL